MYVQDYAKIHVLTGIKQTCDIKILYL